MRKLRKFERPLVQYLFESADIIIELDMMQVESMADEGMGSLTIAPFGSRKYGSSPAECHFYDSTGVLVLAKLNLDERGIPFEIDIWKVDFAPLITWPKRTQIQIGIPIDENEHLT